MEKDEKITKEQDLVTKLETRLASKVMVMEAHLQTSDFRVVEAKIAAWEAEERAKPPRLGLELPRHRRLLLVLG